MNIKLKESPLHLSRHMGEIAILIRIIKMCLFHKKLVTLGFIGVFGLVSSQLWLPYLLGTSVDTAYEKINSESNDFSSLWILAISIISVSA